VVRATSVRHGTHETWELSTNHLFGKVGLLCAAAVPDRIVLIFTPTQPQPHVRGVASRVRTSAQRLTDNPKDASVLVFNMLPTRGWNQRSACAPTDLANLCFSRGRSKQNSGGSVHGRQLGSRLQPARKKFPVCKSSLHISFARKFSPSPAPACRSG
jgi:hypothetical protein